MRSSGSQPRTVQNASAGRDLTINFAAAAGVPIRPRPMMAPLPPADFVRRPAEFNSLKRLLLASDGSAVGISAALRGAGGYGKTTLAMALAHDPDISKAFADGILWVELGERLENLPGRIADLVIRLTGSPPGTVTPEGAADALREALADRRILLIVDDVWRPQDLRPFLHGGRNTKRLITTRIDHVLPEGTARQTVDAMQADESLKLLTWDLPKDQVQVQRAVLAALSARLGEWPLLLKLVNGYLRDRVNNAHESLERATLAVNRRLDARGLTAFDARDRADRSKAVAQTMGVSLELLATAEQERFAELGVFPGGVDIPIGVVERLWSDALDDIETDDLLARLQDLSLLLDRNLDQRTIRLHNTVRQYLRDTAGRERLVAQNRRLLTSLDGVAGAANVDFWTRQYFYRYRPHHLAEVHEGGVLDALLLDPGWLKEKLESCGTVLDLISDYDRYGTNETHNLIRRTLQLTAGIYARDRRQLLPQLLGRLMACEGAGVRAFADAARRQLTLPAILTERPTLTPPGAETARLQVPSNWVTALCVLPDGRLASGSKDRTVRLWDVKTGAEPDRLKGHSGSVTALCVLPDGRLASASDDRTIRLWNMKTNAEADPLKGHSGSVTALCLLHDGRLASGSDDRTIRLWDVKTGTETARLEGHSGSVMALCVLPNGQLASGSDDGTIRLWDVETRATTGSLKGHSGSVTALCVLPDGRLASGSADRTIRLWDVKTRAEAACFEGHSESVRALCVLPDGLVASGSDDKTIRLWDLKRGAKAADLEGHSNWVMALCVLPDGRLASGSKDRAIRLWEVQRGAETTGLEGHSDWVRALCLLPDGRLASASDDRTIRLWDARTGVEVARLEGHSDWVTALCVLPDGRLASGSKDRTIRLWDVKTGAEPDRLEGHSGSVMALCALPDGRLASGSDDRTIRLWDLKTNAEDGCIEGHSASVMTLCMLPDGQLASGGDRTIRLWDVKTRAEITCLKGHAGSVVALCVLSDGRLASGSVDRTIRLWDVKTGATTRLEGHSDRVTALCALPDGRLASGSDDRTIRLWDAKAGCETARIEIDAGVLSVAVLTESRIVGGDQLGRVHWLEIVDLTSQDPLGTSVNTQAM